METPPNYHIFHLLLIDRLLSRFNFMKIFSLVFFGFNTFGASFWLFVSVRFLSEYIFSVLFSFESRHKCIYIISCMRWHVHLKFITRVLFMCFRFISFSFSCWFHFSHFMFALPFVDGIGGARDGCCVIVIAADASSGVEFLLKIPIPQPIPFHYIFLAQFISTYIFTGNAESNNKTTQRNVRICLYIFIIFCVHIRTYNEHQLTFKYLLFV